MMHLTTKFDNLLPPWLIAVVKILAQGPPNLLSVHLQCCGIRGNICRFTSGKSFIIVVKEDSYILLYGSFTPCDAM